MKGRLTLFSHHTAMFIAALVREKTLLTGYTIGLQVCIYVHSRGDQSVKVSSKLYLGMLHFLHSKQSWKDVQVLHILEGKTYI